MLPYFKMRKYADKNGYQQIQLIYFNESNLKLDTGVKTKPEYWTGQVEGQKSKNQVEGRVVSRCSEIKQDSKLINLQLDKAKKKLADIIFTFRLKNDYYPDIQFVKESFYSEKMKIDRDQDVRTQLYKWIPEKEKKHEVRIYYTVLHDLIDMTTKGQNNWKKISKDKLEDILANSKPLLFSQITNKFKEDYIDYLKKRETLRLGEVKTIQYNTINKRFEAFRAFLTAMHDKGINEFDFYKKFKTELEEIDKQPVIIPRPKEFITLMNADLSLNQRYEFVRAIFVVGCLTGLRFGDLIKISKKNIEVKDGVRYIITDISKTEDKQVRIPLHDIGYKFLTQYNFNFIISNQDLNRNLHEMFEHLKFDREVTRYEKRSKKSVPINLPFHKLVTMHSSRRFFISTLINSKKVSLGNIMKWTRHSTDVILSYIEEGYEEEDQMREVFSSFEQN